MRKIVSRFLRDDRGATAIEYGLIIAMISLAIVLGVGNFADQVAYLWGDNSSKIVQGLN